MGRIRTEILFSLDADIWIARSCCGRAIWFRRDGVEVQLQLPPFDKVIAESISLDNLHFDGYAGNASGRRSEPDAPQLGINQVRVTVWEDLEGMSEAELSGPKASALPMLLSAHQKVRIPFAERIVVDFLDSLRVRSQSWLGPIGSTPYSVMRADTYDDRTNLRFKFSSGSILIQLRAEGTALDAESFQGLGRILEGKLGTPPLPEGFLADAHYYVALSTPQDLQRAILFAAIACELKVKETLRAKVFPGGVELVQALISNPRDFSMSAAGLFDKALKAAVGRSLKEENSRLYNSLNHDRRGLFNRRNKIVHSGVSVERRDAQECVAAASQVFEWLDGLPMANNPVDVGRPATSSRENN